MDLLTTGEAARYLRLKERKLYELVATAAIPCTKITGRWLFPKPELDRWLASGMVHPDGMAPAEPLPIVGGSHDPLLEWALRESGSGLATLPEGSEAGLARFAQGELVAAAIHLHAIDGTGADEDENVKAIREHANLHDAVLVAFCRREQGLVVDTGNPLDLTSIERVLEKRARMAMRPKGAGAQLLLEAMLFRIKAKIDHLAHAEATCPTGPDIAQAIRAGRADCGIATRSVATAAGLGFVPLTWERFDLLIRQRHYFHQPLQALLRFVRLPALRQRAQDLGGYDVTDVGEVRAAR